MLAAGPRDIMVPQTGYDAAREVLLQAELLEAQPAGLAIDRPGRILAGLVAAIAIVGLIVWALTQVGS
jgi:hypothetical protein